MRSEDRRGPRPAAEQRRAELEAALASGLSVTAALEKVGKSRKMWERDRAQYPHWKARWDAARLQAKQRKDADPETFAGFVTRYFPDRRPHLAHQLLLAETLEDLQPREMVLFLLWPEAGKTAVLEDYVTRKLALDPAHRIRYVSETTDLSQRVVGTVKRRMTDDTFYREFIDQLGPFHEPGQERAGKPWGVDRLSVYKNPGSERDVNLVASSIRSAVYGARIDTLIIDDAQSLRNYTQAADIFHHLRGTFFSRGIEMRTIVLGTRIGPGDLYERFLDSGLITRQVIVPAAGGWGQPPDHPTVPDYWQRPDLFHNNRGCCPPALRACPNDNSPVTAAEYMQLIRFQVGDKIWHTSYQQQPVNDAASTFGAALDHCLVDRPIGRTVDP